LEELNYFNYFTELEEAFIRRRGKHLFLSPLDWALIETWKQAGVPLHVAIRGIERSFDSYESKPRHRSVKSLMYCREEVEAQHAEWVERQVGSDSNVEDENGQKVAPVIVALSRDAILQHLRQAVDNIDSIRGIPGSKSPPQIVEAFERAGRRLGELISDVEKSAQPDWQRVEDSLTDIERMLDENLEEHAPESKKAAIDKYCETELAPYKRKMDKESYGLTHRNLYLRRLRDEYSVPKLSLFYL
jgi:hypothetical protein